MTESGPPPEGGTGHDQLSPSDGEQPGPVASPLPAEPAPPAVPTSGDEATVIDLRTGRATPASDAAAGAATPPPIPSDLPIPTTPAPGLTPERVGGTRPTTGPPSVVRSLAPLLVVPLAIVLVGMIATASAALRSASIAEQAATRSRASATTIASAAQVDQLWSGVLSLVAAGVGQEVVAEDEVRTTLGSTREGTPPRVPGVASGEHRVAVAAHDAFVDEVSEALDRSDAEPVELGNELDALAVSHGAASGALVELADALARSAETLEDRAGTWRAVALLVALVTVIAAAVAALVARRRLVVTVDRPAARISRAVHEFAGGDATARTRVGTGSGLAAVGRSVDQGLERLAAEVLSLRRRAEWGEQSRAIFEALDEADDEATAHRVITRALTMIDEQHHPVEFLLAERGSTHLHVVAADETVPRPACPVESTGACPALRRGQVAVFDSSESINTCPHLRDRPGGPRSAVCVPVTVATRPVGVLHVTGPEHLPPRGDLTDRLVTLSVQVGNRLGALRTLETTRKEAATDGLTGLPNRRMLESEVATLLERGTPFVMVLADLDKFKKLNDSFGHEVGDKALQLFAGVLRDNVRGNDVVSRLGGEEFVLVYPNMSVEISIEAIGRLRQALARAVAASRLPAFTCSFGITHSDVGGDGDAILRVADAGLLRAKELGGDQAVFADEELAAAVFSQSDDGDGATGASHVDRPSPDPGQEPDQT